MGFQSFFKCYLGTSYTLKDVQTKQFCFPTPLPPSHQSHDQQQQHGSAKLNAASIMQESDSQNMQRSLPLSLQCHSGPASPPPLQAHCNRETDHSTSTSQAHCNTKTDHSTSTSQLTVTQKQIIPHPHHSVTQKQITPHSHHRHSATKTDYSTSTSKGIRETDHSTSTSQGNRETDHSTSTSQAHTTQATEHSPTDPKQAIPLLPCDNRITEVIAMHIFKSFTEARAEKPGILPPF